MGIQSKETVSIIRKIYLSQIKNQQSTFSHMGASKNSNFLVSARKRRAQDRSVYNIHEDLSTVLTLQSREKCIFRGAHIVLPIFQD